MQVQMKQETIDRRASRRALDMIERKNNLIARLREKAEAEGPDSIWAELLREHQL